MQYKIESKTTNFIFQIKTNCLKQCCALKALLEKFMTRCYLSSAQLFSNNSENRRPNHRLIHLLHYIHSITWSLNVGVTVLFRHPMCSSPYLSVTYSVCVTKSFSHQIFVSPGVCHQMSGHQRGTYTL